MNTEKLTAQFGKKNIPDIRPGDTARIYFKITEGGKTRIQIFEGLVISQKHGKGLDGSITLRKISNGVGVERTFPLHSPLITKFEKVKQTKVRRAKLYFIRESLNKRKSKRGHEFQDFKMWEEAVSEEELEKIEEDKAKVAEEKAQAKAKKEEELKEKFDEAVKSHIEEKSETSNSK